MAKDCAPCRYSPAPFLMGWLLLWAWCSLPVRLAWAQHSTAWPPYSESGYVAPDVFPGNALITTVESPIQLDTPTLSAMLDFQNRQSEKQLIVLQSQADSDLFPRFIPGGQIRASASVSSTNTTNKFPYLGRFPTDFAGRSATDARIMHANAALMFHAAPGVSGYLETLFSDVFTFPSFNQGSFQMRQAYLVIGDLERTPFYGFIGKKNVSFGDFRTLSPFTQAMPWHYFAPLAEGLGVGYAENGLELSFMAINGGRGIRVTDSPTRGKLNNFSANAAYTIEPMPDVNIIFGAGYLHGTIYDGSIAEHLNPAITGQRNPAWDVHSRVRIGRFYAAGEYVETVNDWPVVNAPVQAYKTELGIDVPEFHWPMFFSASWSQGFQGDRGTTFRSNNQLVIGAQLKAYENVSWSLEYVRSLGFAPLINITTVSDPNVVQNTFLVGLVVTI